MPVDAQPARDLQPVEGRVIRQTRTEKLVITFLGLAIAPLSYLWVASQLSDGTVKGLLLAAACAVMGTAMLVKGTMSLFVRNRCLVIGRDRLQVLAPDGQVEVEVPYANIARVNPMSDIGVSRVEVTLRDPQDPATTIPGGPEAALREFAFRSFHMALSNYKESPKALCARIEKRLPRPADVE
jgi:hypothetical protein